MSFRFSHIADCHVGGLRDPRLKELTILSFEKAIDISLNENVDFILISGDLFNSALPGIDFLNRTVKILKKIKKQQIPVYVIAGSHDYSLTNKTMLEVLESADLITLVNKAQVINDDVTDEQKIKLKPIIDKKTNSLIVGVSGKKGALDKEIYSYLDVSEIDFDSNFFIFMFHNGINELLPRGLNIDAVKLNDLPKGFNYYAAGHIHYVKDYEDDEYRIVYPGPTFPENFLELKNLKQGSFSMVEVNENNKQDNKDKRYLINVKNIPIKLKNIIYYEFDCNAKTPEEISKESLALLEKDEEKLRDSIILLKFLGKLQGRLSDIDFKSIFSFLHQCNVYVALRNTAGLVNEQIEINNLQNTTESVFQMEDEILSENFDNKEVPVLAKDDDSKRFINNLFNILAIEKDEDETKSGYEERISLELENLFKLEDE